MYIKISGGALKTKRRKYMKRLGFLVFAVLMFLVPVFAVNAFIGQAVTFTATSPATVTFTAASVSTSGILLEIMIEGTQNTAAARSITMWDSSGNTFFARTFNIGEVAPTSVFINQVIGMSWYAPAVYGIVNLYPITGNIYIKSDGLSGKLAYTKK